MLVTTFPIQIVILTLLPYTFCDSTEKREGFTTEDTENTEFFLRIPLLCALCKLGGKFFQ